MLIGVCKIKLEYPQSPVLVYPPGLAIVPRLCRTLYWYSWTLAPRCRSTEYNGCRTGLGSNLEIHLEYETLPSVCSPGWTMHSGGTPDAGLESGAMFLMTSNASR